MGPMHLRNEVLHGDNLPIMRDMDSESVHLIYADPPFNSGREWSDESGNFSDTWDSMDSYIDFMGDRMMEMKRLMSPAGSVYIHCDDTAAHYLKVAMDEIFGMENFKADIIWRRTSNHNQVTRNFGRVTDHILFYSHACAPFNMQTISHDPSYIEKFYTHDDNDGRGLYRLISIAHSDGFRFDWKGYRSPPNGYLHSEKKMRKLHEEGKLNYPSDKSKLVMQKIFLSETDGQKLSNLWTDIVHLSSSAREGCGYPTQKPLALLERIILSSTDEGDMVFDPFCGSGTTLVAAAKLNRKCMGCDVSAMAVALAKRRIADLHSAAE